MILSRLPLRLKDERVTTMSVTGEEIQRLLDVVRDTQAVEIDCDICLMQVGEFAEDRLAGKPITEGLKAIEQHLLICPECREEFEALCQAMNALEKPES